MRGDGQHAGRGIPSLAQIFFGRLASLFRARRAERRAGRTRFRFQSLEPRVLLSADLVGSVDWHPDDPLLPGDHEQATVVVRNVGNATVSGSAKVNLYASADGVLDASDVLLDSGRTGSKLKAGASSDVRLDFDIPAALAPGEYSLIAKIDPDNKVAEGNEANNVAVGSKFTVHWMFGSVPGHGYETLIKRDADGTNVLFSLSGPGAGEITLDHGRWDLTLTGTNENSVVTILTMGGGNGRVALDDIHVRGALGSLIAPTMDLTGTLAVDGPLSAGLLLGSATDAVIAAPTVLGTRFLGLTVQGISILGDLKDSEVLIGANLGADGQPGGTGADADSYSAGNLGNLLIAGSMIDSCVRVGQDPVDGVFDNGDDALLGGSIRSITIGGDMSGDSCFVASRFPDFACIDGHSVNTDTDLRFIDELALRTISIGDVSVTEGNSGTTSALFTVSLNAAAAHTITVGYGTSDGTAAAGSDYNAASGVLTFAPGEISKTLAVQVLGDSVVEGDETFRIDLSNAVNALIDDGQGTGTILNDDVQRFVSIGDVSLTESDNGTSAALFHVTLTGPSSQTIAVNYATSDGTAAAGSDYNAVSGTLVFAPGETSKIVAVQIFGDVAVEADETFMVDLSNAINVAIADGHGTGTILNDDVQRFISIGDVSVTEGNNGITSALFTVSLDAPLAQTITVGYATSDGTAAAGSDYNAVSGTLTFAPGETSKTLAVQVLGDSVVEGDETFRIDLSNAVNALIDDGQGTGAILNDDTNTAPVASPDSFSVDEDGTLTVPAPGVLGNDTDAEGSPLTVSLVSGAANGALTFNADGSFVYSPDLNFNGSDSFTYRANDGDADSDIATVSLTIDPVNDKPVAVADEFLAPGVPPGKLGHLLGNVLANDTDVDGDPLSAVTPLKGDTFVDYDTDYGNLRLSQDGDLVWSVAPIKGKPEKGDLDTRHILTLAEGDQVVVSTASDGTDLTYAVTDSLKNGLQDEAAFSLTITGVNDAPEAFGDAVSTEANTPVVLEDFIGNHAFDWDHGEILTLALGHAVHGQVAYDSATGAVAYTPDAGYYGDDSFDFIITDFHDESAAASIAVTIDAPAIPFLTIDDVSIAEGDDGATNAVFTVTLTNGPAGQTVAVAFVTQDGSASAFPTELNPQADYDGVMNYAGALVFEPGVTQQTISVPVHGDTLAEGDQWFFVNLFAPANASLGDAQGRGLILDDDPLPELTIGDAIVVEGDGEARHAAFQVGLSEASELTVSVDFGTADGSAIQGVDYSAASGNLVFSPGVTQQTIFVEIAGDTVEAPDRSFFLNLGPAQGAVLADAQAVGTILDDDGPATLSISDTQVVEGTFSFPDMAVFTVSLVGHVDGPVTVHVATADGTAQGVEWDGSFPPPDPSASHDYVVTSGDLAFAPGEMSKEFRVFIGPDGVHEGDETFRAVLSAAQGAAIADGTGVATILDDDPVPGLYVGETWVREDEGGSAAIFEVALSGEQTVPVTVDYATHDGTAAAGSDYQRTSGTLTFAPGERSKSVVVPVLFNPEFEGEETFSLVLSGAINAGILMEEAQAHVLDALPRLSVSDTSVIEGDSGTTDAVFTLTLSRAITAPVTVSYYTYPISASGDDFTGVLPGEVQATIAAGETSATIAIPVLGDLQQELDETFALYLLGADNAEIVAGDAYATIVNDDPGGAFSISDAEVTESEAGDVQAVFTVTLDGALPGQTASVRYYTYGGSADPDYYDSEGDYAGTGDELTFGPGVTQQTFTVTVHDDFRLEGDESFFVYLTEADGALIADGWGTGLIHDNEPLPVIFVEDARVIEGSAPGEQFAVVRLSLSQLYDRFGDATVDYATTDGSALAGLDYQPVSGTVHFNNDWGMPEIRVPIIGNTDEQPDRSFFLTLSGANGAVIDDSEAEVVILDDDHPVSVSINDADPAVEGSSFFSFGISTFVLTLSGPTNHPVSVDVSTEDGTAQGVEWDGSFPPPAPGPTHDYISGAGTVTFAPGETVKTIQTYLGPDTDVEPDETFFVNLSNAQGATIADGRGEALILNDDQVPGLFVSDTYGQEVEGFDSFAYFQVSLTGPVDAQVSVDYATADGTATAGSDYEAASGTLSFAPGEQFKTVAVRVLADTAVEGEETFSLLLGNAVNAPLLVSTGTGAILDGLPTLSIDDTSVVEGDSGTAQAVFAVHLSYSTTQAVTVSYFTSPITAIEDVDYAGSGKTYGELVIPAGETSAAIAIAVHGDTENEIDETFSVVLTGAVNAYVPYGQATGTIIDDDPGGVLTIGDATLVEGDDGETQMVFTVSLADTAAGETVEVNYFTQDGFATSDDRFGQPDYLPAGGTLTFAPGETSQTIAVTVLGDTQLEVDETFFLRLGSATNAVIADGVGMGTIIDDEPLPEVIVGDYSVIEGDAPGSAYAVFYLNLSTFYPYGSGEAAHVWFTTADGSAHAGEDYEAVSGSAMLGDFVTTVFVPIIGDTIQEGDETFSLILTAADNALITDSEAQATIIDDDGPLVLSISDAQVVEGSAFGLPFPDQVNYAAFTVSLQGVGHNAITVDFATADGTATGVSWDGSFPPPMPGAGRDYVVGSGTLSFSPGETEQTVYVPIGPDRDIEHNETFFVDLSNAQGASLGDAQGIGTIIDDDPRFVAVSFSGPPAAEGSAARFELQLASASEDSVSVDFTTIDGSALAGVDYQPTGGTVVFAPGQTLITIDVPVLTDAELEGEETFFLAIENVVNATPAAGGVAEGHIASELPRISVSGGSVQEGDAGTTDAVFTVTLSEALPVDVSVDYQTFGYSAEAGVDFAPVSGTLTIAAGGLSGTVTVAVNGDDEFEPDELFVLALSNPVNADLAGEDSTVFGTIINDDVTVSIQDTSVVEGDAGYRAALFTVALSNPLAETFTVNFATQDGSAVAGADYVSIDGTLSFAPGETTKQFTIPVAGDQIGEPDESFQVTLSDPSAGAALYRAAASGFIADNDPGLSVGDTYITENIFDGGGPTGWFFVLLNRNGSEGTITVEYTTADGSAQAGSDYEPASGVLVFEPGQDFQYVTVGVPDDDSYEPDETFSLVLSNASGAGIIDGEGIATIIDNDSPPVASIYPFNSAYEEAGVIEIPVFLSAPSGFPVSISYSTEDWTAVAGEDYVATSGELAFAPGESQKTIVVQLLDDARFELNESFRVVLIDASGALIGDNRADLSIGDQDPRPRLDISSVDMAEGNSGFTDAVFTVTLDAPAGAPVSVGYHTLDGNTVAGSDYAPRGGVLVFAPGETVRTIAVPVFGDLALEGDEVFYVVLDSASNADLPPYSGQGWIRNDDVPPSISIADVTVVEGTGGPQPFPTVRFEVSLSAPSLLPVTVGFATSGGGSATPNQDYVPLSGNLVFQPGQTSMPIQITVIPDGIDEPNETFLVRLSGASNAVLARDAAVATIVDDDPPLMLAAAGGASGDEAAAVTQSQLDTVAASAVQAWVEVLGNDDPRLALLQGLKVQTADLEGNELGAAAGGTILIDADAAGHGWFVEAASPGEPSGHMDLVTVVEHEIGHVLGFGHEDAAAYPVMREELAEGARYALTPPEFDLGAGSGAEGAAVAWSESGADWTPGYSPCAARTRTTESNFADYLVLI